MSSSNTNTCLASAMLPNTAAMALRASPGTRWRIETRTLYIPPLDGVAKHATGSRTAVTRPAQAADSVFTVVSCAVSVRPRCLPPMVTVWNNASLRCVIAVRWNTGLRFTTP